MMTRSKKSQPKNPLVALNPDPVDFQKHLQDRMNSRRTRLVGALKELRNWAFDDELRNELFDTAVFVARLDQRWLNKMRIAVKPRHIKWTHDRMVEFLGTYFFLLKKGMSRPAILDTFMKSEGFATHQSVEDKISDCLAIEGMLDELPLFIQAYAKRRRS